MTNEFVFVTALYNLKDVTRDDSRNWNDYLKWFESTLKIKCPFIIFTQPELKNFILNIRENYSTTIIESKIEDIPYYNLKSKFELVLNSNSYQTNMKDLNRVECQNAIYPIVQYSKFKWLEKSTEIFNSKFYFWLDAGASRFIDSKLLLHQYPSECAIRALEKIQNTLLIQYNSYPYQDLTDSKILDESYLWDNRSFICGSMFGGNKIAIQNISNQIDLMLNQMIELHALNNEQIALGYLCKKYENLFTRFYRENNLNHLCLFQELSNYDRI